MNNLAVTVSNLTFNYSDKPAVLNCLDLTVKKGESLGLIGPNGAGKTTLFLHLNGLLNSHNGTIEVLNIPLADKDQHKLLRRKVGIVFQNPEDQLFCPTVFDDVAFGPLNHGLSIKDTEHKTHAALESVNMKHSITRPSHHLSFGEKRLVAIASVLATDPELILFDEPSSNLDPRSRSKLVSLINEMPITKIIATHDFELILETCTQVAILYEGKITQTGKPQDILYNEELLQNNGLELPYLMRLLKDKKC